MNIAIFGGSFDPVHMGHYKIIRQTNSFKKFDTIYVVPAFKNPLKNHLPTLPEETRLSLLKATFAEFKNVKISSYELDKGKTSYTYNTLLHFRELHPKHRLFLILGEDSFASFHLWANADKIVETCSILSFYRPATNLKSENLTTYYPSADVTWAQSRIPDISATIIRKASLEEIILNNWLHPDALKIWMSHIKG